MVPAMALLIYRFITNKDCSQYEIREKYRSSWEAFNITDMSPYKDIPE